MSGDKYFLLSKVREMEAAQRILFPSPLVGEGVRAEAKPSEDG
jgi:hypothetical protein